MTQTGTDTPPPPAMKKPEVEYEVLDLAAQKEMVRQSLLNLERLHLECRINLAINEGSLNMTFEDGGTQTLDGRMEMLDDKLERFKVAFKDLM